MNTAQAVAKRISELLLKNKMTQYALAKKMAVSQTNIHDILNDRIKTVSLNTLYLLADGFDMTIHEFLNSPVFDRENLEY